MKSLSGKKLLILGGNALSCDIVTTANNMGIYTIVTDWNDFTLSPAKKIADESHQISITDYDRLVEFIKINNIDGIFTNYVDSYLVPYSIICNLVNLPCLATVEQINKISNKDQSKQLCIDYGISVPKRYKVSCIEDIYNMDDIVFPVLTKPVDNSGQRGIFVCKNKEELGRLYAESLGFSASKNVMVEEYIDGDYTVMFYTIQNGKVTLSAMADKPAYGNFEQNLPKLPMGYFLPSNFISLAQKSLVPKVQSFVSDLNIQNGVVGIEAVIKGNDIFVFEMQFRLGGMKHHTIVQKENGIDLLAMLIRFALTGKFEGWDASAFDNASFTNHYCSLNVLIQPGSVKRIENLEIVRNFPQVTAFTQMIYEGEMVRLPGTVQQIFCKFSLIGKSREDLLNTIKNIHEILRVYDDAGVNLIMKLW